MDSLSSLHKYSVKLYAPVKKKRKEKYLLIACVLARLKLFLKTFLNSVILKNVSQLFPCAFAWGGAGQKGSHRDQELGEPCFSLLHVMCRRHSFSLALHAINDLEAFLCLVITL